MKKEIKSLMAGIGLLSLCILAFFTKPFVPEWTLWWIGGTVSIILPFSLIVIIGMFILLHNSKIRS